MKNYSKQFMAWATALLRKVRSNIFLRARLELTAFYLVGMILVLGIFTAVLIVSLEHQIEDTYRKNFPVGESFHHAVSETDDTVEAVIYTIDGFLLLVIGTASYVLAGRTLRPIQESLESQRRFSADASHDLRTPLSVITTESEVALAGTSTDPAEYRKVIGSVLEEARSMSTLVEDLLLLARGDEYASRAERSIISLGEVLTPEIVRAQKLAAQKGVHLSCAAIPKVSVRVNARLFPRVIQNILQNAVTYTPSGGSVTVGVAETKGRVSISVEDTGVGIAAADLAYVFDRFYKAEHSRKDGAGSGLGLSIAKAIVEHHEGSIKISSNEGLGTRVDITL